MYKRQTGACERSGAEIEFYHMDEGLHPVLEERTLPEGEYLYLVNYYGQLTDDKIRKYKKIYGNIIVDHTHAFFQKPLPGVDTLYSCRKFLGVSDGAYPVSYTHLDVYKRQDVVSAEETSAETAPVETETAVETSESVDNAESLAQDEGNASQVSETVSYTHLDVYKRQIRY